MSKPPLNGIRVIEFAGIGPVPFASMMLADHGANIIRIDRPKLSGEAAQDANDPLLRSRRSLSLDLKNPKSVEAVRRIVRSADAVIEGFRPGVMERLGLGPDVLLRDNPRLVYGRMTGWGQTGPRASEPGHDINYIATSGVLHALGRAGEKPTPPINLLGDYGGGAMFLLFGLLAALLHAQRTGEGQVVDAAMADGASMLMTLIWKYRYNGFWNDVRGTNLLDTGAHFYDTYETSDGKFIALGAIEGRFYTKFLNIVGLSDEKWKAQMDARQWPALKIELISLFKGRTRDDWIALFKGHDICLAPVLDFDEALADAHNQDRNSFITIGGMHQPSPSPRYSASEIVPPRPLERLDDVLVLRELEFSESEISALGF